MGEKKIFFSAKELDEFRNWINLNMDGLTWQGRYSSEFEDFWTFLFFKENTLFQITQRLQFAHTNCKIGPLSAWFNWLQEKFISFTFVKKQADIYRIAKETGINISNVARILRDFFMNALPHLDEYLGEVFQVGNMASENLHISFLDISGKTGLMNDIKGADDEVMSGMEVTLYEEWNFLCKKMKKDFSEEFNLQEFRKKSSIKQRAKFLQEVFVLLTLGGILIYGIHIFNKWKEIYLTDKVNIYEPQFKWPEQTLKFKVVQKPKASKIIHDHSIKPNFQQIEEEQKMEQQEQQKDWEQDLFESESEVMITSWDALPRDFDTVTQEQSEYEELRKGGYRDTHFGNKTVYRVMMRSASPFQSREELNGLLARYGIIKVDNVRPGLYVPGGFIIICWFQAIISKNFLLRLWMWMMPIFTSLVPEGLTHRE